MKGQNKNLNDFIDALKNTNLAQGPSEELVNLTLNKIAQGAETKIKFTERNFFMRHFKKLATAAVILVAAMTGFVVFQP